MSGMVYLEHLIILRRIVYFYEICGRKSTNYISFSFSWIIIIIIIKQKKKKNTFPFKAL